MNGVPAHFAGDGDMMAFVAFQAMFAIITAALITGAIADRVRFGSFVVFITVWSAVVYLRGFLRATYVRAPARAAPEPREVRPLATRSEP